MKSMQKRDSVSRDVLYDTCSGKEREIRQGVCVKTYIHMFRTCNEQESSNFSFEACLLIPLTSNEKHSAVSEWKLTALSVS